MLMSPYRRTLLWRNLETMKYRRKQPTFRVKFWHVVLLMLFVFVTTSMLIARQMGFWNPSMEAQGAWLRSDEQHKLGDNPKLVVVDKPEPVAADKQKSLVDKANPVVDKPVPVVDKPVPVVDKPVPVVDKPVQVVDKPVPVEDKPAVLVVDKPREQKVVKPPETKKLIAVKVLCKDVCVGKHMEGICVPLDRAIFVYRSSLPTSKHVYYRNDSIAYLRPTTVTRDVVPLKRCRVDAHFPGTELIPRQASCALVGNGGILSGSGCGQRIDSHNFVIRANLAPIVGFETDVGRKASLSAFNAKTLVRFRESIMENAPPETARYRERYMKYVHNLNDSILWYLTDLRPPHDEMYRHITNAIRETNPKVRFAYSWKPVHIEKDWVPANTTAPSDFDMYDLYVVARTFCDKIDLYGFYPFPKDLDDKKLPHHYYDEKEDFKDPGKAYDYHAEHRKLKELDAKGDLKLVENACSPKNADK